MGSKFEQGGNTAPISARGDYREVMEEIRDAKKEAVAAGHVFNSYFPVSTTRSTASRATIPTI